MTSYNMASKHYLYRDECLYFAFNDSSLIKQGDMSLIAVTVKYV